MTTPVIKRETSSYRAHGSALALSFTEFVGLIALLMALTALSIDIMLPALPDIGRALGVTSDNDQQFVVIAYMGGFAFGQLFYGPLSDHLGRRPVLMAGLLVFLVGTLGAIVSTTFAALLTARVVQGFGAASPRVIAVAIVRDIYGGRDMARVMSLTMMVFIIVPVLAPSIGQTLIHVGDWHWAFYGLLVCGLAAVAWAGVRLPETHPVTPGAPVETLSHAFRAVVLNSQTMVYGLAGGLMFGCLLAYVASSQQVFVGHFKMGDWFPLFFGAVASTLALASFINSRIVGTYGMRRVSHAALVGFCAVAVALAVASALGWATLPVFVALVALAFFMFGLIAPNFNSLAMEPQGAHAGLASSVVGSLSTAIGAVTGGVIGRAFDGTVLPLAIGFAASSGLTVLLVYALEGRSGFFGLNRPTGGEGATPA